MNQLQDPRIIGELYRTGQAGVPISLNVRGLCCLRAGFPLSENIRVFSTIGRFLEHGRIYRFENGAILNSSSVRPTGCGATFSAARNASYL